jgi:hypothetical protein
MGEFVNDSANQNQQPKTLLLARDCAYFAPFRVRWLHGALLAEPPAEPFGLLQREIAFVHVPRGHKASDDFIFESMIWIVIVWTDD